MVGEPYELSDISKYFMFDPHNMKPKRLVVHKQIYGNNLISEFGTFVEFIKSDNILMQHLQTDKVNSIVIEMIMSKSKTTGRIYLVVRYDKPNLYYDTITDCT